MSNYNIREYRNSDKSEVLRLLSKMWNVNPDKLKSTFEWKYDGNPILQEKYRYVALHKNKIVGFRGFFPNKLIYQGTMFNILSPSDMIVSYNHRRQGLFRTLTEFSIVDIEKKGNIDFFANFSSNKFSSPGYLKMGWSEIEGCNQLYSKTLTGCFLGKISGRKIYKNLKPFFNFIDRKSISHCDSNSSKYELEIRKNINLETISFLNSLPEKKGLRLANDSKNLYWRFRNPLKTYFLVMLKKNNHLLSYLVLEKKSNGSYFLLDFNYLQLSSLKQIFVELSTKYNINLLRTWVFPISHNDLIKCNFFRPNIIYKLNKRYGPSNFLIRPIKSKIKKESWIIKGIDIRDSSLWNISPIISDGK